MAATKSTGRARFYTLVPNDVEDAPAWAFKYAVAKGYEVIEEDYTITPRGRFVEVAYWVKTPQAAGNGQAS